VSVGIEGLSKIWWVSHRATAFAYSSDHAMVVTDRHSLLVFGGFDSDRRTLMGLWKYDLGEYFYNSKASIVNFFLQNNENNAH
jgi:hypothetical protein